MGNFFDKVLAIPILAIFLAIFIGAGALAYSIAQSWTHSDTQYLVGSFLAICGGSVAIIAVFIGVSIGMALYKRMQPPAPPPQAPDYRAPGYTVLPYQEPQPPQLTAGRQPGHWSSNGPASYDLWDEQQPEWRQEDKYQ